MSGMAYSDMKMSLSLPLPPSMLLTFLFSLLLLALISASPMSLTLERAFPNHGMDLSQLRARDMHRHGRMLQSNIVNFPLHGNVDPIKAGFYYTNVQLGSPPREFHVLVDTGSDIPWVSCGSCSGCPQTSDLPIKLNYFDPGSSSTSSFISCSDHRCKQSRDENCSIHNNHCSFKARYADGASETSGYYVSDVMHLANIVDGSVIINYSVPLVFGCSNLRTGSLTLSERAFDGILGFGPQDISFISQLYSQGIAPKVFSHCLKGDISGGGILVLCEIVEPNIIYSSLVPKQPHYNLNLQSISVNGHMLQIDPAVFVTSRNRGAVIDSGTTLAYLVEGAYNPLIDAITSTIPQSVRTSNGSQCYLVTTSITDIFPQVSLNFADGASLVLRPQDYLIQFGGGMWCHGFQKTVVRDVTILGELVLKDKIIVYDLVGQRIGWANHDRSLPVNVNVSASSDGSALRDRPHTLTMTWVLAFLMHVILHQVVVHTESLPRSSVAATFARGHCREAKQ